MVNLPNFTSRGDALNAAASWNGLVTPASAKRAKRCTALWEWKMETEQNLKMELLTISDIGTAWKCDPVKLPQYCQLDFALTRQGKIEAFAEVKCRTFERTRHKTSLIHLHKMMYARQVAFETGIPTFLIVRWTDCIGACSFKVDFATTIGGRRDRGIERDYGLMAEVPVDEFHIVRELNETI